MFSDDTKRPNYRDGQYLGPQDFVAEQQYHRDMRRRLNLGQNTYGIYTGLDLSEQLQEGSTTAVDIFITPGLAVDGFGREILVFAPIKLDPALFARFTVDGWVEVWLAYDTEQTDPARHGYELCDDPSLAYRTRETFGVKVGPRASWFDPIVIAGKGIPTTDPSLPADLSVPYQALPDDDERGRWLIMLGFVHWNGSNGFIKSQPADQAKHTQGRVYGGAVSAHTYAPDDEWELAARRPAAGGPAHRARGFIRGKLTVEDLIVARGQGIEMEASPLSFVDAAGQDSGRPLTLTRAERIDSADLRITIGNDSAGKNRLVVQSGTTERVRIKDNGDLDITGKLHVDGITDLVNGTGDRLVAWLTGNDKETAALGVENGGMTLYSRAGSAMNWYVGATHDAGTSARMLLDAARLRVRGDMTVGAGSVGHLKTRHVDGKDWQSDADADLFLNWGTGKNVVVGQPGGTPSSLIVTGNLVVGNKTFPPDPILVDVIVGNVFISPGLNGSGSFSLVATSRLPVVSDMQVMLALTDISNVNVATDARWSVVAANKTKISTNSFRFDVNWIVGDSDGFLRGMSYMAVFVP